MKYLLLALVLLVLFALLFPRRVPRLLRKVSRFLRGAGDIGREIATGEEVRNSPLARYEVRAGEIYARRVLDEHALCPDANLQTRVATLGSRLAEGALRREIPYRFCVLEMPEPNALAVPGGAIFVSRSLIDLCEGDDNRIAGVLAHEMVHVDRRHILRTLMATTAVRTGIHVLSAGRTVLLSRLVKGIEDVLVQGYRQDQELEADALGSRVAARAGFEPGGLLRLLETLRERHPEEKGGLSDILSYFQTHPALELRIAKLRRELARPAIH